MVETHLQVAPSTVTMFPPAEGEWESKRAIQFLPRRTLRHDERRADFEKKVRDAAEHNNDCLHCLPSDINDDDSICSFLSILDPDRRIATTFPSSRNREKRKSLAPERLPSPLPSAPSRNPKTSGQDLIQEPYRSRLARRLEPDFTIPTEMERSFLRNSRIAHRIQSESEKRFHRYIDHLEAQQRRYRPTILYHDSNERLLDEDSSMMSAEEQQQEHQEEHKLPAIAESTLAPSPSSTVDEYPMPFNTELALARQRKRTGEEVKPKSIGSLHLTPVRAMNPSPNSIWPSPSPVQSRIGQSGAWWVAVPAASESGEVWEDIDEAWPTRNRGRKDRDGKVSTFTAHEDGLEDEKGLFDDVNQISRCKQRWSRCKKVLKRVLIWKR